MHVLTYTEHMTQNTYCGSQEQTSSLQISIYNDDHRTQEGAFKLMLCDVDIKVLNCQVPP